MPRIDTTMALNIDRFLVYLFTLFLVWPIWFIEQYLYSPPAIIEEGVKLGLVYWLVRRGGASHWWYVALIGISFALSETIFYLLVANNFMSLEPIAWRLLFTWPMHIVTVLLIWRFGLAKIKGHWVLGFVAAMLIHAGFNWLLS